MLIGHHGFTKDFLMGISTLNQTVLYGNIKSLHSSSIYVVRFSDQKCIQCCRECLETWSEKLLKYEEVNGQRIAK